jgi:hypothetical protein
MRKITTLILTFAVMAQIGHAKHPDKPPPDYKPGQPKIYDSSIDDRDLFKKDDRAIFVNAEFLYWTVSAGDLDYAFKYSENPYTATNSAVGEYKLADYDFDPGFRVAVGWFNAPNYWQMYWQFTWMRIRNSNSETSDGSSTIPLVGTFNYGDFLGTLNKADSDIRFNEELGDWIITRVFVPNPHLRMKAVAGFTGGRVQEVWKVKYIDTSSHSADIYNKWKFLGIGLRAGIDFDWFMGYDIYITGKGSLASLIGKQKNTASIKNNSQNRYLQNIKYDEWRGAYNFQFLIGPSYQRSFPKNRLEIFAGYEWNSWMNVHEIIRNTRESTTLTDAVWPEINKGAFLLHGLTARMTVDF